MGFHPEGAEVGTVKINNLKSHDDPLFCTLPEQFLGHATHSQTVLELPPQAVRLASNSHENNHAFRMGDHAWGVQFHPEFTSSVMKEYIQEQKDSLLEAEKDYSLILDSVRSTPLASSLLSSFGEYTAKSETRIP